MLTSVLMPMRNAAPYVKAAIDSVLAHQGSPLELIVMDDGSTDESAAIVRSIEDARVRLYPGPQKGISACMNAAWAHATGDVVMRCDADDLFTPGRIADQLRILNAHPDAVAVAGGFSMIDARGRLLAEPFRGQDASSLIDITRELQTGITRTHLCAYAIRREAVSGEGPFREYFETAEDIDFALRLGNRGKVLHTSATAYLYRIHAPSITHTSGNNRRVFFESTARSFAVQRMAGMPDALAAGCPPAPPAATHGGHRAQNHVAQLREAECWRHLQEGHAMRALELAWLNVVDQPAHWRRWQTLVVLCIKAAAKQLN
jgi:glycosyltransferase involved in cell wall biosynthesis